MIDGGPYETFDYHLMDLLDGIGTIDLLVLTHIDADHIEGLTNFIDSTVFDGIDIKCFWINCANLLPARMDGDKIAYKHAITMEELLIDKNVPKEKFSRKITDQTDFDIGNGIKIEVLSPPEGIVDRVSEKWPVLSGEYLEKIQDIKVSGGRESQLKKGGLEDLAATEFKHAKEIEDDLFNSSSIAFVIWGIDFSFLALADSRAEIVEQNLKKRKYNDGDNKLIVDYVKVSHHGSHNNTSNALLGLIDCGNYIFSTNGGTGRSRHPSRETIARILYHPGRDLTKEVNLYFNYPLPEIELSSGKIFTGDEMKKAKANVIDNITLIP
ncbi:hypothetical protein DBR40_21510 [Pedobacter sp. KBW01]|nr:hypothetical protein DBR40_21510 [Pedobacter sp. KBW01]